MKPDKVEDTNLQLPSDFTMKQRQILRLDKLAREEKLLREGELADGLASIRSVAQSLSCTRARKRKHARHQGPNTRANSSIEALEAKRSLEIELYNHARERLLKLVDDDERFPPLTVADTYRKPTETKRLLGVSRIPDGKVWTINAKGVVNARDSTPWKVGSSIPPSERRGGGKGKRAIISTECTG